LLARVSGCGRRKARGALRGGRIHGETAQRLRASKRILYLFISLFIYSLEESGFRPSCITGFPLRVSGFQRQGGECVFASQSGGSAGGGVQKTPAGDYSINTHLFIENDTAF
jgi:hypothetical protein